jgi:hypothetical protein
MASFNVNIKQFNLRSLFIFKKIHLQMMIFVMLFVTGRGNLSSQILNIERFRIEKDTLKPFKMKTSFGFNLFNRSAAADSPVNLLGYNIDHNMLYFPGKHAYSIIAKFDYLRINDRDFLNFGFVHARAAFYRKNRISFEVFSQYSYDNFRGLDPRLLTGAGGRYKMLDNENLTLILGFGAFYETERWVHPQSRELVDVQFIKSSNYFSIRYSINDIVDFNTINYYQVAYDRSISGFRNRISSITSINSRITRRLSLRNSIELNYEDRPIVPVTRLIFALRMGFSFDL